MTSSESREDSIYFARLSEQGERYEDMIKYMQIVAKVSPNNRSNSPVVPHRAVEWREEFIECGLQKLCEDQEGCLENN